MKNRMALLTRPARMAMFVALLASILMEMTGVLPAHAEAARGKSRSKNTVVTSVAKWYAEAIASGNQILAGRLDFACMYHLVSGQEKPVVAFPPDEDPIYARCWERMAEAHQAVVEQREQGMYTIWPGKGSLVFFAEDLSRYVPSVFVMDRLGVSPPGGGLRVDVLDSSPLPAASFRLHPDAPTVAARATLVRMRVSYKDPILAPITFAPGTAKWTNTVKRPRQALKALTVQWVALSGLKRLGFPGDVAILNVPVAREDEPGGPIPFVTERGGYQANSAEWWQPADAPGLLIASVGRASQFPEFRDRIAMLNRILIIDPNQPDALSLLARDLYDQLLRTAADFHQISVADPALAKSFNELYWNTYAQTTRTEISLGMEMGGFTKPTPADYLYRLIPAMEKLAKVRPEDLTNRLRLGIAYRWNNDQLSAIATHEALLKEIPPSRQGLRVQALIELAWSRIAKVAWNRTFSDPGIEQAHQEAAEAFQLAEDPADKFMAAYAMAYSLVFTPDRDNRAILERLTKAHEWYLQLPGATPESWRYLLSNDTLKGVVEADPAFQPLLAAS